MGLGAAALGFCILAAVWECAAWIMAMPVLPPPTKVLPVFFGLIFGELGLHFLASAGRVTAAVAAATLAAVPAGLAMGLSPRTNALFSPIVAFLYPVPKIVLLPVIFVIFGITDLSKVFLIALIIFFQILVTVRDEAMGIHAELIASVRSLGAGRRALFRFVYFPACLPAVLSALRVSTGIAVAVLFIAEQSLTDLGLGYFIVVETYQIMRYEEMYAGILGMSLLGFILYMGIDFLERRLCPWRFIGKSGAPRRR
jgi:NitT/TauT family transport system permease protein